MAHKINVVIPVYDSPQELIRLIQCLLRLKEEYKDRYDLPLFFVDDASSDPRTRQLLMRLANDHTVLVHGENTKFTKTVNDGIKQTVDGDFLIINQDAWWEDGEWFDVFIGMAMGDESVGLAFPKCLDGEGRVNAWAFGDTPRSPYRYIEATHSDFGQYPTQYVGDTAFFCVFLKRKCLDDVGLLDENLKHYLSDTDYCLRMQEKGWNILYVNECRIRHDKHACTDFREAWGWMNDDRERFREKWPEPYRPRLNMKTYYGFPSGYSHLSANVWKTLEKDVELSLDGWGQFSLSCQTMATGLQRPYWRDVPTLSIQKPDILKGDFIYTMLEVSILPKSWVRILNECQGVVVPSRFNVETFINAGVTAPLHVMHPPYDPIHLQPTGPVYPYKMGGFHIFSVFEWGERKFPQWIKVAQRVFAGKDVAIYLLTRGLGVDVKEELAKMRVPGGCPVIVLQDAPNNEILGCMYRGADLFVLPSCGEGWGYPYVEAMSTRTPCLATNWGGNTEFMNPANSLLVDYELTKPYATCPYYQEEGMLWAEPKEDDLADKLLYAYDNYDNLAPLINQAWQDVQQFTIENQRKAWLSFCT
ncbi:MAG: glycosyltransferase, partial [bacterium]